MLALAYHYNEPVAHGGSAYRARVYGEAGTDGMWGGWIVFFPVGGGRVIATSRDTTQSSLADLEYWASGLTHSYLHGALERAIALQPEAELARELERFEREEESAETRASAFEAAASLARTESRLAEAARDATAERLLGDIANAADRDAEVHQAAARRSHDVAQAADRALKQRKRNTRAKGTKRR